MESFEQTGRFWLPADKDRQVAGVLRFDRASGAELALIGALHEEEVSGTPLAVAPASSKARSAAPEVLLGADRAFGVGWRPASRRG